MTWEDPPRPRSPRPWLVPTIASVVLLVAAAFVLAARSDGTGRLTIRPTPDAEGTSRPDATTTEPRRSQRLLTPFAVASEVTGDGPLFDGAPDLTLVVGHRERLALVDVQRGDIHYVELPRSSRPRPGLGTMFSVGPDVIINHHNTVIRLTHGLDSPIQMAVDSRAIPTFDDASLWVSDELTSAVASTAARVALDGTVLDRVRLPAISRPIAGTADGLVVAAPGSISMVNGDGATEITSSGDLIASNGRQVARADCDAAVHCLIVLGTIDNPDQTRTPLAEEDIPAGYFGLPTGAYSPDGRWVAIPLYQIDDVGTLDRPWIAVIDTATGAEKARVEGPFTQAFSALPLAWSADSQWLFVASQDGITSWNAATGEARRLALNMETPRALAVAG
jgi:hypothetical protein